MRGCVALINPNNEGSYRSRHLGGENLGICSLAASLHQEHFNTRIVDARLEGLSHEGIISGLGVENYLIIGVSLMDPLAHTDTMVLIKRLKQRWPEAHITLGGYYPTFFWQEILADHNQVDSIIPGEGEFAMPALASAIREGLPIDEICLTPKKARRLPSHFQPRSPSLGENIWLSPYHYAKGFLQGPLLIESSRGCYGQCSFCAVRAFFNHSKTPCWRGKPPSLVIEDIEMLLELSGHKCREFQLIDVNFIGPAPEGPERAREIARRIIEKNLDIRFRIECRVKDVQYDLFLLLKQAGLIQVFLGLESGSQRVLNDIEKNSSPYDALKAVDTLRLIGINYNYGFFMCDPEVTLNEIKENLSFLSKVGNVSPKHLFHHLMPIKGTPFWEKLDKSNRLIICENSEATYRPNHWIGRLLLDLQRYLETVRERDMEKIWKCYREIQLGLELGDLRTHGLEKELTKILINSFYGLLSEAEEGQGSKKAEVSSLGDRFLSGIMAKVEKIRQKCPVEYRIFRGNNKKAQKKQKEL